MVEKIKTPYGVMCVVLLMYLLKVMLKLSLGTAMHSPLITGDGFHNLADIFEAGMVLGMLYIARLPASEKYPFGRKSLEYILQAAIGFGLLITAREIISNSLAGLAHSWEWFNRIYAMVQDQLNYVGLGWLLQSDNYQPLVIEGGYVMIALVVVGIGACSSFVVSRLQIQVGSAHHSPGLVSDGNETRSDGWIEVAICIGIFSRFILNIPWLEYVCGFFIGIKLMHVALEIGSEGIRSLWSALLSKSIGTTHDVAIKTIVEHIYGVESVSQLKTFLAGNRPVIILKIQTLANGAGCVDLKHAIANLVIPYLVNEGFETPELFIRFELPPSDFQRVGFAIMRSGDQYVVADSLTTADSIAVCDKAHRSFQRITITPLPKDSTIKDRLKIIQNKRITILHTFRSHLAEKSLLSENDIELIVTPSYVLSNLGVY